MKEIPSTLTESQIQTITWHWCDKGTLDGYFDMAMLQVKCPWLYQEYQNWKRSKFNIDSMINKLQEENPAIDE